MEFKGKYNISNNPELQSMLDNVLKPVKIYHAGDYKREHIVINVCQDCYLSNYVLVQIVRNEEDIPSYGRCRFLTFAEIELLAGDTVKVMTCCGVDHEEKDVEGHTSHVLYWNLSAPVWTEGENEVMLMERGESVTCFLNSSDSGGN